MSDDILDAIDASIARNRARFDPLGEAWDEDRVERFNDGMRVRPASTGSGLSALPVCRGCRDVVLPLPEAKLCGPCSALPSCRAERSNERTGRRMVCFRPAGHEAVHEDITGSQWVAEENRVEALRPFFGPAVDAEAARLQAQIDRLETLSLECGMGNPLCSGCDGLSRDNGLCQHECHDHEPSAPLVDASSDTAPDVILAALEPAQRCHLCDLPLLGPDVPCVPCTSVPPLWVPPARRAWWRRWTR